MSLFSITQNKGTIHAVGLLRAVAISCIFLASSSLSADVWVAGDARIERIATSGRTLVTVDSVFGRGFKYGVNLPGFIGVDQRNGHVWVSDVNNDRVFELDPDGEPLREVPLRSPFGIGIDPNSGAVWTSILTDQVPFADAVIKLDPNTGAELVRVTGFSKFVSAIAVAPSGRVWIADRDNDEVVVLFGTDEELNGYDASGPSGPHHLRLSGFDGPFDIAIDPGNRYRGEESTWIADQGHGEAVKLASDGSELVRVRPTGFYEARDVSVNPRDGSLWVGDPNSGRVAKLSFLGKELENLPIIPTALAIDGTDDAVWIGTGFMEAEVKVLKLDPNGSELLSKTGLGLGIIRGIASVSSSTVIIDGCNSWVTNTVLAGLETVSDLIADCAMDVQTHGHFVSCVAHVSNELDQAGIISGLQKGAIQSCAAQAHIPRTSKGRGW